MDGENPHSSEDALRAAHRTTSVIAYAVAASVVIYAVVVELILKELAPFEGFASEGGEGFEGIASMRYALGAVAVVVFIGTGYVRDLMLRLPVAADESGGGSGAPPELKVVASKITQASIVSMALAESIAVLGIVLFVLTGDRIDFYLFFAFSIFAFYHYFPRYDRWVEWARRAGVEVGPGG